MELASAGDAEVIAREVEYYRTRFQRLSAAQTDAATAGLREAEEHRALRLSEPTVSSGSD